MLAIERSSRPSDKTIPNILPCKLGYNGPVNASKRFWNVEDDENSRKTAYFRGRKLYGKDMKLPESCQGVAVQKTGKVMPSIKPQHPEPVDEDRDSEVDEEGDLEEVQMIHEVATFDSLVIWGHESLPVESEDPYIKGIHEWSQFAKAIHSYNSEPMGSAENLKS